MNRRAVDLLVATLLTAGMSGCESPQAVCGNGVVELGEECDLGSGNADTPNALCRSDCLPARCGDDILDDGEQCDNGPRNSDAPDKYCRTNCEVQRCGDGILDQSEACEVGRVPDCASLGGFDTVAAACRDNCQLDVSPCGPDVWRTAQAIDIDDYDGSRHYGFATRPDGTVLVVWVQAGGLWSNWLTPGAGWGSPEPVATGTMYNPAVALDDVGNAMAIWEQSRTTELVSPSDIRAARYQPGLGWDPAELVETDTTGSSLTARVVMDSGGNAIATWSRSDGTRQSVWARRNDLVAGWGAITSLEVGGLSSALGPLLAIDGSDNVIAVWREHPTTGDTELWTNRYVAGSGWAGAEKLATSVGQWIDLEVGDSGRALVVVSAPPDEELWLRYTPGSGWGTPEITTGPWPHVAMNDSGDLISAWSDFEVEGYEEFYAVYASFRPAGGSWSTPEFMGRGDEMGFDGIEVALGEGGDAIVVWESSDSGHSIVARRFRAGSGWGVAAPLEYGAGSAEKPLVVLDAMDRPLALWRQRFGVAATRIFSNRTVAGP